MIARSSPSHVLVVGPAMGEPMQHLDDERLVIAAQPRAPWRGQRFHASVNPPRMGPMPRPDRPSRLVHVRPRPGREDVRIPLEDLEMPGGGRATRR